MSATSVSALRAPCELNAAHIARTALLPILIVCCGCPPAPPSQQEQQRGIPSSWIRVDATGEAKGNDGLEQRDAEVIGATVPTVSTLASECEGRSVAKVGEVETRVHLSGTSPEYLQLLRDGMEVELTQGRFLMAEDEQSSALVVVLDEALAATFFPDDQPVGRNIIIGEQSLTVVGVLRSARHPFFDDIRRDAYVPFNAFNAEGLNLDRKSKAELDRIWVRVDTYDQLNATKEIIQNLISRQHPELEFSVQ